MQNERYIRSLLNLTVSETADTGVDVHVLAPGMSMVPLWKSRTVPYEEHRKWWYERYGTDVGVYLDYLLRGGDIVDDFIEICNETKQMPFISVRMNDGHHLENINKPKGEIQSWMSDFLSRFYHDNQKYVLGNSESPDWSQKVLDWTNKEVRDYKYKLIRDLCENYDIDGLELDFIRYYSYFNIQNTTSDERVQIITDFVSDVRKLLDATSVNGKYRYLSVRVPSTYGMLDYLGLDIQRLSNVGVDIFNVSPSYVNDTQPDISEIKNAAGNKFVCVEITHCNLQGSNKSGAYDGFTFARTTPNQIYTTAHYAYARGADGVSAFNFAYYREHGEGERGPFNEPPFEVFKNVRDKNFVAHVAHQYYLFPATFGTNFGNIPNVQVNRKVMVNKLFGFTFDIAIPDGGYLNDGKFRLRFNENASDGKWTVKLNGVELAPNSDTKENYDNPFTQMLGEPEDYRCFIVPKELICDGENYISAVMTDGTPGKKIIWADLCLK